MCAHRWGEEEEEEEEEEEACIWKKGAKKSAISQGINLGLHRPRGKVHRAPVLLPTITALAAAVAAATTTAYAYASSQQETWKHGARENQDDIYGNWGTVNDKLRELLVRLKAGQWVADWDWSCGCKLSKRRKHCIVLEVSCSPQIAGRQVTHHRRCRLDH